MYNFPSGLPGIGLSVLRVALTTSLILDGTRILAAHGSSGSGLALGAIAGYLLVLCALLVVAGFLNAIVQSLVLLIEVIAIGRQLLWAVDLLRAGTLQLPLLEISIALALALVGPGAYSIDARLFGRQEIIIPPPTVPNIK